MVKRKKARKARQGDPEKIKLSADQILEPTSYHTPVLLQEAIDGMNIRENGVYVDCTFGGGGHSREILKRLGSEGRLFVFDQDADVKQFIPEDPRVVFVPHNFRHLKRFLRLHKAPPIDGILADLGVSSHQFDEPSRGFSIRYEGDLDMRMDKRQSLTAAEVLNTYSEQRLHKLFEQYGEVTNAKTLAKAIVGIRNSNTMKTTEGLKQAISHVVKGNPHRYFAQVFQALRIEVNDEFGALKEMLTSAPELLKQGGRIVIITFHSLEDRIVKIFFKKGSFNQESEDSDPFGHHALRGLLKPITKKPIVPNEEEINLNKRSRSAALRIAEKE